MDTPNLPKDIAFRIELPSFEGPLDLLLHLIKKHELNVLDLPIAFVTERYLHYLQMMQELDLDVASEYLLMAATLAHIKSKSLLPASPKEQDDDLDDEYVEDPRAELIRRLLEYQKYKHAAHDLGERPIPGRDVFTRGTPAPKAQGQAPLADVGLFKLLDAFEGILKRVRGKVAFEVTAERISIQERMTQITEFLRIRKVCGFEELFEADRTRYDIVVTFLALLEMTKLHVTRLFQADVDSPIQVTYALLGAGQAEPGEHDSLMAPEQAPTSDARAAEIGADEPAQASPWATLDPDLEALDEEFGQDFDVHEWLLEEGDDDDEDGDTDFGMGLVDDESAWSDTAEEGAAEDAEELVAPSKEADGTLLAASAAEEEVEPQTLPLEPSPHPPAEASERAAEDELAASAGEAVTEGDSQAPAAPDSAPPAPERSDA